MSTEQDNDTINITRNSLKGAQNHERRKETRRAFLRRAAGEGYSIFEGDRVAYGYRTVQRESAQENARQIQKEIEALGIDANIITGPILWNLDGITSIREVPQAVTVGGQHIFISNSADIPPRNVAGHEAFHLWKNRMGRTAYIEIVEDNLIFTSQDFLEYQSAIAEAYLGEEADLSNDAQVRKLREELFAYISGDIHEGVNDAFMRPMFRDFDTVKSAWGSLVRENSDEAVNGNLSFGERDGKTDIQRAFERAMAEKRRIRFSLKTPIEGSADLIALHNLSEQSLLDALRLGGLPMPSIAVTKVGIPHLEYGRITLILDKEAIDPEADRRNMVYGADIESPTIEHAGEAQTLEEIVEAMKRGKHLPKELVAPSLQSVAAARYESLEEIQQDSGRLRQIDEPAAAEIYAVQDQIEEILREVRQQSEEVTKDAARVMLEAAAGRWTEEAITERFAEAGYRLDEETVRQIQEVYKAAAELPVEYFEAKPERAIGFEEIVAAVVPDDSSEELLERLKEAGVRTLQYQTWDDGDRVDKVNEIQEARFSLKKKGGKGGKANSDSGVLWAGSETAMDRPAAAEYNEAGKGQSTSSSNSSSGILWAGSDEMPHEGESEAPDEINYDLKQVGKKYGEHREDYPDMESYTDYKDLAEEIFNSPDQIIHDKARGEYYYTKGNDLMRIKENGDFVSLYPGAESERIFNAIKNGGVIWP